MRRARLLWLLAASLLAACEDGPDQFYKPNPDNFNPKLFNGFVTTGFISSGDQPFQVTASGQKTGTVKICEADELAKRWTEMVKAPIVPTKGAGGLNLRNAEGQPEWSGLTIDDAQQVLCQAYVYSSNIVFWGDNAELIAVYDSKTRLISTLATTTGYEGTIVAGPYVIANNKPVTKDGKPIVNDQNLIPDADLRQLNIELLKAYRPELPNPDQRDCVAVGSCYAMTWQTLKLFYFNDVQLLFATEPTQKKVAEIDISLDRNFEFGKGTVKFEMNPAPTAGLPPVPKIDFSASCHPTVGDTWDHIRTNCLGVDPEAKALTRPVWDNEAMYADMGGLSVFLVRPGLAADAIIPDGDRPQTTDQIVGMQFTTSYEGKLQIDRTTLFASFSAALATKVKTVAPTVDTLPLLAALKPYDSETETDPTTMRMGTLKAIDGTTPTTLTMGAAKIVQEAVKTATSTVPAALKDPNFYVEVLVAELLAVFNEGKQPDSTNTYYYFGDDTAEVLYGHMVRTIGTERYAVTVVYHSKTDQLLALFFKRGVLRTEDILYKIANGSGGVFSLSGVASSAIGLGTTMKPKSENLAIQRAMVSVQLGLLDPPLDVLVSYHPNDGLSGYAIPVKGQRDLFMPGAYYGFAGNNVGVGIWTGDYGVNPNTGKPYTDVVMALSSGSFYDKLDFCGQKVGLFDSMDELLNAVPSSCDTIIGYSANGKFIYSAATYLPSSSADEPVVGVRLFSTAGRISGAYYWME